MTVSPHFRFIFMNKTLLLLLLLCLIAFHIVAQNLQEYYVSKIQSDGTLYFIFSLPLFEQQGSEDLKMDITYKTGTDSATLNFTYSQKAMMPADSVSFLYASNRLTTTANKFYIETHKMPIWEHRYSVKLPFKQLSKLFEAGEPVQMVIHSQKQKLVYTSRKASWKKHSKIINAILYMAGQ